MKETLRPAVVSLLLFTVLLGFVYPLLMDGIAAVAFPSQSKGSLLHDSNGRVVGSSLIGQPFDNPAYFWSRPTADVHYNAATSAATNQGPSSFVDAKGHLGPNATLKQNAEDRIAALRAADPGNTTPVPVDLVTASASGLDPHISPAAAYYQMGRVARVRGTSVDEVKALVDRYTEGRTFGVLGEPRVNVLLLDRALDDTFGSPH